VARLRARVAEYDENLTALGLDDHELDRNPPLRGFWFLALTALQFVFVMLLLPPLLLLGYAVNGPPALAVWLITKFIRTKKAAVATQKIMTCAVAYPLTWIATIFIGAAAHERAAARLPWLPDIPILFGIGLAALSIIGAAHVLRYQSVARQTLKNLRVRFRRARLRDLIDVALRERAGIFDELMAQAHGLVLPGDPGT